MSTLKVGFSVKLKKGNSARVARAKKSVYMYLGVVQLVHVLARRVRVLNRLNTLHKSKLRLAGAI